MAKKIKGKQWYTLVAPKLFSNKVLGETPVGDPKTVQNRTVTLSLTNVINDPSKYYFKITFKVKEVKDGKALTEFWKLECLRDYISRMVRHGLLRMDNVNDVKTKDDVQLRVKTVALTSRKAKKEVEVAIRKYIDEQIKKKVSSLTLDDFLKKAINDKIKRSIIEEGSKIYPIYKFELRKIERL